MFVRGLFAALSILLIAACLFPPWVRVQASPAGGEIVVASGCRFVVTGEAVNSYAGERVDGTRLLAEVGAIAGLAALVALVAGVRATAGRRSPAAASSRA